RDFVVKIRRHTEKLYPTLESPGFSTNFQPITMYRNRELAAHRRDFDPSALRAEGEPPQRDFVATRGPTFGRQEQQDLQIAVTAYTKERQEDHELGGADGGRRRDGGGLGRLRRVLR